MTDDAPLWRAENQDERLKELLGIPAGAKEAPLRRDVRSLGRLLGNVIKEQEGKTLFETVEALRTLSISGRAAEPGFAPRLDIVRKISVADAAKLAKAFAMYFELTNLAETNHRKRRRRASQLSASAPQPGTFKGTLLRIRYSGIVFDEMLRALQRVVVVPVFTAHPTEVARRTVLWKRKRIAQLLEALDSIPLVDARALAVEQEMKAEIAALWQSDEVRRAAPTVLDEVKMGLDYSQVLFETIPELYVEIEKAIDDIYIPTAPPGAVSRIAVMCFWH